MSLDTTRKLIERGAHLPAPETVYISPDVNPALIAPDVTIHPGCRITGNTTAIGPGCELGREAPVTLDDCQLGAAVRLHGGYFSQAVFLDRAQMGSAAQVRPGTLVEEEAGGAHAVGLKQTVLMPFVTLGSLINFCDCLMAGGTSRKNHSEVGSSYVHFNFTPHQDKATPSLLGNVSEGVWLDRPPIFLGGQGGLVGPARVCFGAIVPAGLVARGDINAPGLYAPPVATHAPDADYQPGRYRSIGRLLANNFNYIGNILALRAWYVNVRAGFMRGDPYRQACHAGALRCLETILAERLSRLDELAARMPRSLELHGRSLHADLSGQPALLGQKNFYEQWPAWRAQVLAVRDRPWSPDAAAFARRAGADYVKTIQSLAPAATQAARAELAALVAAVVACHTL